MKGTAIESNSGISIVSKITNKSKESISKIWTSMKNIKDFNRKMTTTGISWKVLLIPTMAITSSTATIEISTTREKLTLRSTNRSLSSKCLSSNEEKVKKISTTRKVLANLKIACLKVSSLNLKPSSRLFTTTNWKVKCGNKTKGKCTKRKRKNRKYKWTISMEEFTGGKEKDNSNRSIKLLAFLLLATPSTHLATPHIRMPTNTQKKESSQLIKTLKPLLIMYQRT